MSYATCPIYHVNINQTQKEDLLRFESSAVDNYKQYRAVEIHSRIRISLVITLISLLIFGSWKFRHDRTVIEMINNIPLMLFVIVFFIFSIKHYYKNLFKSKSYIRSLNKTLKGFNLYLDNKSLKLCVIGGFRKE
ncbi:conserved Plasmodium protein, unknown function [Plasmodium gonderi]|uniref:Uncharacterized protein n=1 Tax=Plasmodium gonderi TaxID=77519 RepID=A0A1Y1JGZ5_PLAGO|nr:conserved Plasmodium protein, unknown function [Plasmodium gonderi]GAW79344.1 conserved Plasmodium protein, unknown function [Plasmodium gonderi]